MFLGLLKPRISEVRSGELHESTRYSLPSSERDFAIFRHSAHGRLKESGINFRVFHCFGEKTRQGGEQPRGISREKLTRVKLEVELPIRGNTSASNSAPTRRLRFPPPLFAYVSRLRSENTGIQYRYVGQRKGTVSFVGKVEQPRFSPPF